MELPHDKELLDYYSPELKAIRSARRLIILSLVLLATVLFLVIIQILPFGNLTFLFLFWYILRKQCAEYTIQNSILTLKRYLMEPSFSKEYDRKEGIKSKE
ncbi:MAG: hypothetical protein RL632_383 [Bacteroidota bacterium]|jgi:hypothetical protein